MIILAIAASTYLVAGIVKMNLGFFRRFEVLLQRADHLFITHLNTLFNIHLY